MLEGLKKLCTPAHLYFLISVISLLIMAVQNLGNVNKYCVGNYECVVTSTLGVFAVKMLYVVFWTWILNVLCRAGYERLSWFVFLLPYVAMFVLIALMFLNIH
ncbi:MAG: hypothetical protein ACR2M6_03900 [Vampirovibrionia bacterium]|jgi:hypothetical protein